MSIYDFHQKKFILQFYFKNWNHFFNENQILVKESLILGCG